MELTRKQVAERLRRSVATVRRLEGHVLHPRRDAHGTYRFSSDEVEQLRAAPQKLRAHGSSPWLRAKVLSRRPAHAKPEATRDGYARGENRGVARIVRAVGLVLDSAMPAHRSSQDWAWVSIAALEELAAAVDAL